MALRDVEVVDRQPHNEFILVVGWDGAKRVFAQISLEGLRDAIASRDDIRGPRANRLIAAHLAQVSALMTSKYRSGQFMQRPRDSYQIDITTAELTAMKLDTSGLMASF